jgi:hypothetical protein
MIMETGGIKKIVIEKIQNSAPRIFVNKKMYEGTVPQKVSFEIDLREYMKKHGLAKESAYEKIMGVVQNCAKDAFKKEVAPAVCANNKETDFGFFLTGNAASLRLTINEDGNTARVKSYLLDSKYVERIRDLLKA